MSEKKGINTTELTLLIVGSTIGSGVFGITSDLATAAAPGPAIIAWIIVGIGVLTLVLSLTNLSQKRPGLDSGIFSYAAAAFGPLGEFISGWAYWLSAWLGNIAFATIMMSALGTFFPQPICQWSKLILNYCCNYFNLGFDILGKSRDRISGFHQFNWDNLQDYSISRLCYLCDSWF